MAQFDNISSLFNGATTTFTLSVGSTPVGFPEARDLDIKVAGVGLFEGTDFTISGSDIIFNVAPLCGFFL